MDRGVDVNLRSAPQMLEYAAIVRRIVADAPASILDWGCGLGQVSDMLVAAGLNVSSFDHRPDAPDAVTPLERYPNVHAYLGSDPRALPYDDESFHAVLSCGVLEHVRDPDASLDELARVLKPGGTLYVYKLPNSGSYLEWIARRLGDRLGMYYHGREPDDRLYTAKTARALIERHGYEIAELRRSNMLPLTLAMALVQRPKVTRAIWAANRALAKVPGLNRAATNVEAIATRP